MDAVRQYVISITASALLCGVLKGMVGKGTAQGVIKILCGTFLAFAFIKPLTELSFTALADPFIPGMEAGQDAVAEGQNISKEAMKSEIAEQISRIIVRKAEEFGSEVYVEVYFSEDTMPVPVGLKISGSISPYAKVQLQQYIRSELGIDEEALTWTG